MYFFIIFPIQFPGVVVDVGGCDIALETSIFLLMANILISRLALAPL